MRFQRFSGLDFITHVTQRNTASPAHSTSVPMLPAQILLSLGTLISIPKQTPCQHADSFQFLGPFAGHLQRYISPYRRKRLCFEPLAEVPAYAPLWHPGCTI